MMTVFERLSEKAKWLEFYEYKADGGHLPEQELQDLRTFIEREEYLLVLEKIKQPQDFPIPQITVLNKVNTNKKRIVFSYERRMNYVLKMMSYLLYEYDFFFTPNLYSFRKNTGVKKAISDLISQECIGEMYSYKIDIHDYFNSVNVEKLLPVLKELWKQEQELYTFIEYLLRNPYVEKDGEIIVLKKGIMAGLPIAPFLANVYLREMDRYFHEHHILYARYSDDIILFADSEEVLQEYVEIIHGFLETCQLEINPKKIVYTKPGEKWEYLGFSYQNGVIDVSDVAVGKMKGKLKRKARAIYRWKIHHGKCDEYAIRAYIKYFNRKFFDNPIHNEITWCRWYFPIINTEKSLHVIDRYMQECIRYLTTGRYVKSNYNLRYETMKKFGYRSLMNEYYKQKDYLKGRIT